MQLTEVAVLFQILFFFLFFCFLRGVLFSVAINHIHASYPNNGLSEKMLNGNFSSFNNCL